MAHGDDSALPALIPRESWLRKSKVRRKDTRERQAGLRLLTESSRASHRDSFAEAGAGLGLRFHNKL